MGIVIKLSGIRQRREACTDILCKTIVFHGRFSWSTKVCLKLFCSVPANTKREL